MNTVQMLALAMRSAELTVIDPANTKKAAYIAVAEHMESRADEIAQAAPYANHTRDVRRDEQRAKELREEARKLREAVS